MNKFLILVYVSVLTLCSSCFELIEEINILPNGKGEVKYTLNGSQSAEQLKSFMALDSLGGKKIPKQKEVTDEIAKIISSLNKQSGISNAKSEQNFEQFIFVVSFSFNSTDDLNKAFDQLETQYRKDNSKTNLAHVVFDGKTFKRNLSFGENVTLPTIKANEKPYFEKATFTSIQRFPKELKSVDNQEYKIAANKKAVFYKSNLYNILTQKSTFTNTVYF